MIPVVSYSVVPIGYSEAVLPADGVNHRQRAAVGCPIGATDLFRTARGAPPMLMRANEQKRSLLPHVAQDVTTASSPVRTLHTTVRTGNSLRLHGSRREARRVRPTIPCGMRGEDIDRPSGMNLALAIVCR